MQTSGGHKKMRTYIVKPREGFVNSIGLLLFRVDAIWVGSDDHKFIALCYENSVKKSKQVMKVKRCEQQNVNCNKS